MTDLFLHIVLIHLEFDWFYKIQFRYRITVDYKRIELTFQNSYILSVTEIVYKKINIKSC